MENVMPTFQGNASYPGYNGAPSFAFGNDYNPSAASYPGISNQDDANAFYQGFGLSPAAPAPAPAPAPPPATDWNAFYQSIWGGPTPMLNSTGAPSSHPVQTVPINGVTGQPVRGPTSTNWLQYPSQQAKPVSPLTTMTRFLQMIPPPRTAPRPAPRAATPAQMPAPPRSGYVPSRPGMFGGGSAPSFIYGSSTGNPYQVGRSYTAGAYNYLATPQGFVQQGQAPQYANMSPSEAYGAVNAAGFDSHPGDTGWMSGVAGDPYADPFSDPYAAGMADSLGHL